MAHKYKVAASEVEKNDAAIRRGIVELWNASTGKPYGGFLRDLTSAHLGDDPGLASRAEPGQNFLIRLLDIIDVMKTNYRELELSELRSNLKEIIAAIETAAAPGLKGTIDFPMITDLVFAAVKGRNKMESEKFKKEYYGKARTGLTRLHSMAKSLLSQLNKFEGLPSTEDPTKAYRHHGRERLEPQRNQLSEYEVMPFIREYGMEYGLRNQQDWATAFRDDPMFKEEITTVINAVNRGRIPRDEASVKMEIAKVIRQHEERLATNKRVFNMPETKFQQVVNVPPQVDEEEES
jgi:hypothetical protein